MVRRRVCAPIVNLTSRMSRLAEGEVADNIPGAERSDEIGAMASAVQVFKDNMIRADRLTAEKQAESDGKMRRAQALDELTRAFEAKVTELVGGLSPRVLHHGKHGTIDDLDGGPDQQPGRGRRGRLQQTSTNVQTVASATEELTSSISEIGRQVAQSPRSRPAPSTTPAAPATPHARSPRARRRSATSLR